MSRIHTREVKLRNLTAPRDTGGTMPSIKTVNVGER